MKTGKTRPVDEPDEQEELAAMEPGHEDREDRSHKKWRLSCDDTTCRERCLRCAWLRRTRWHENTPGLPLARLRALQRECVVTGGLASQMTRGPEVGRVLC